MSLTPRVRGGRGSRRVTRKAGSEGNGKRRDKGDEGDVTRVMRDDGLMHDEADT